MDQHPYYPGKSDILKLAGLCLADSCMERPELTWLKQQYERRRRACFLNKTEMDSLIYQRMYGHLPDRPCEILKIRYWRTGHHVPMNRRTCFLFGQALGLSTAEQNYLLQAYLDRSLTVYEEIPSSADRDYWRRRDVLDNLVLTYLGKKGENGQGRKKPSRESFRHIYYMDALRCIQQEEIPSLPNRHIRSVRYDAELQGDFKLIGEIPRKTMIRHLILLGLPGLDLDWLNRQLSLFGYLPLAREHTLTGGERLDQLLIGLLELYQELFPKLSHPQMWFYGCCRDLDAYFQQKNRRQFRFMYFKSLE